MLKNICSFLRYVNAKRYYFTSGDEEVEKELKKYEEEMKKNDALTLFFLLFLEKLLLTVNLLAWSVIVMLFVFIYVFLFLPLCVFVRPLFSILCFILNTPGARVEWLEKKAEIEKYNNQSECRSKEYRWQKKHQLSLCRWNSSGKKKNWFERLFDSTAHIRTLEKIRGIKKEE